jgi:acyl-[acyl-carrier-protein] desaturase
MSYGYVDQRLENRLKELYKQHKERAAKIDWSYHSFLPLEIVSGKFPARNINPIPTTGDENLPRDDMFEKDIIAPRVKLKYDPQSKPLSWEIYLAVETALLTEVNLPWFTTELHNTFKGSLQVLIDFVHTWTAEEDQHGDLLETYLLLTGNGDVWERRKLRKQVIEGGFETGLKTPLETMVYTSIQERATMVFYLNVAQACESEDPALARVLRRLARDETLHYTFYRDATKAHLEVNPNLVELVTSTMLQFEMPGRGMPDYKTRMEIIAKYAHYGPAEYYTQVVDELMKFWDIRNLQPSYPQAREAQFKAIQHHERLGRIAARQMRERQRLEAPSEESVMDELNFHMRTKA